MALLASMKSLEEARLEALRETQLLDSAPEHFFDLITGLAAKVLNVPVVLMSLVDADRQFFKSQCGLPSPLAETRETPLSQSFCQYVAAIGEPFVVEDARTHPLVRDNDAVVDFGVIAYAGMPLTTEQGHTLGSFCALDTKPRRWTTRELELLRDFAQQVMAEITLRARLKQRDGELGSLRASVAERRLHTRHIVHDLRTPLNALYLGIDALTEVGEVNSDQQACLELVRNNANVLRDLVHRLLAAGATEDQMQEVRNSCSPAELVQRALVQVATLADKAGIELEDNVSANLPNVFGHAEELVRVLVNLIANGVKFTPRGGAVQVSISAKGDAVDFVVADNGIGIAVGDQRRVFREGVRVNEAADQRHSSGIGLAFCKQVIEQHGGQLALESVLGEGSSFSFSLPAESAT